MGDTCCDMCKMEFTTIDKTNGIFVIGHYYYPYTLCAKCAKEVMHFIETHAIDYWKNEGREK